MSRLLLVKNQPGHAKDEIVGVFDDSHKFSVHEEAVFTILEIEDVGKEAMIGCLKAMRPTTARIYNSKTTGWALERPEKKVGWKHSDNKWYFLEGKGPEFTVSDLTITDRSELSAVATSSARRLELIGKIKSTFPLKPENFTEIIGLEEK